VSSPGTTSLCPGGCGQPLETDQAFCPRCGNPVAHVHPAPSKPRCDLSSYARKIRILGLAWLMFAVYALLAAIANVVFLRSMVVSSSAMRGPLSTAWFGPSVLSILAVGTVRGAVLFFGGWGLLKRWRWGRRVAIAAGLLVAVRGMWSLIDQDYSYPLDRVEYLLEIAFGVCTLVVLMGSRNQTLYDSGVEQASGSQSLV
jgi:hypothetical protein